MINNTPQPPRTTPRRPTDMSGGPKMVGNRQESTGFTEHGERRIRLPFKRVRHVTGSAETYRLLIPRSQVRVLSGALTAFVSISTERAGHRLFIGNDDRPVQQVGQLVARRKSIRDSKACVITLCHFGFQWISDCELIGRQDRLPIRPGVPESMWRSTCFRGRLCAGQGCFRLRGRMFGVSRVK